MYIVTNALQNLVRNRGRNLMISGIILVMIVSVVTALMINNTSSGVIDDYKTRFGSEVVLSPDQAKLREQAQQNSTGGMMRIAMPQIAPEDYVAFGQSDLLQKAEFYASTSVNSDQLTASSADLGPGGAMRGFARAGNPDGSQSGGREPDFQTSTQFYFTLNNTYADFENSTREIDDSYDTELLTSRFPAADNECMLSSEVMEASGLKLSDKVTVTGELTSEIEPSDDTFDPENPMSGIPELVTTEISWTLTVVGVYSDITQTDDEIDQLRTAWEDRRNDILTTFDTFMANLQDGKIGIRISATYYLSDPNLLEAFDAELRAKGLSEVWMVTTDSAGYDRVVRPVVALKGFSTTFVIIVLAFGAIILALLSSISIRERKYEIGVLRAMGMKRLKVLTGLWTETLAITGVCLIMGLGVGALVAQPVTDALYDRQLAAAQTQTDENNPMPPMGPGGGVIQMGGGSRGGPMGGMFTESQVQPLQNLDISLGWVTILQIIGVALLLSSVSGIIATTQITKYEPIKILMERN